MERRLETGAKPCSAHPTNYYNTQRGSHLCLAVPYSQKTVPPSFRSIAHKESLSNPFRSIRTEEALNLDLQFDDGIALELIFRVGFQASVTLLEYRNGDARVLKRIKPRRRN